MTRLLRRTSLLVALCLLTWAATASAECAVWVLWSGGYAVDSYLSRDECLQASETKKEEHKARMLLDPPRNQLEAALRAGNSRCFPDTFNPRPPRAK